MRRMPWISCGTTLVLCLALGAGCTGEIVGGREPPAETFVGDAGDPRTYPVDAGAKPVDAADLADPAVLFAVAIDPILGEARPKGSCAGCHEGDDPSDGPDFLGADPAGHYESLTSAPRILGEAPEASLLYTRGDHAGDAFCTGPDQPYAGCQEDEVAAVANWIRVQAASGR